MTSTVVYRPEHNVRVLDVLIPEPGSIYAFDRAYVDFARLWHLHESRAVFVTRAKKSLAYRRPYSAPVDRATGVFCDQAVMLTGRETPHRYPAQLRRVRCHDPESGKVLVFLTNDFALPATTVAALYRSRWKVELFFNRGAAGRNGDWMLHCYEWLDADPELSMTHELLHVAGYSRYTATDATDFYARERQCSGRRNI